MAQIFKLSMPKKYTRLYPPGLVLTAMIAVGLLAHEGWEITVSVKVFLLFALPFSLLFLYILFLNPMRTKIILEDDALRIKAPPFYKGSIPYTDINKAAVIRLDSDHPLSLFTPRIEVIHGIKRFKGEPPRNTKKRIKLGCYRVGIFTMKNERLALVMANRTETLCVETIDKYFLLAPDNFPEFVDAIKDNVNRARKERKARAKAEEMALAAEEKESPPVSEDRLEATAAG